MYAMKIRLQKESEEEKLKIRTGGESELKE
jgi:hypothetical protein